MARQPLSIDRSAASITQSLVEKSNRVHGTHRIYPTKEEIRSGYAIAVKQAQKLGRTYVGTNTLTPQGEAEEVRAALLFKPEKEQWLQRSLSRQRKITEKKNMRKSSNPKKLAKIDEQAAAPKRRVSHEDAKTAIKRAGSEVGTALWTGGQWAGERLWAGTKEGAKLVGKGIKKGSKVGAKYTAEGLDWAGNKLESYAARPNPRRFAGMTAAQRMQYVRSFKTAKNPSASGKAYPEVTYTGPVMKLSKPRYPVELVRTPRQCRACKSFVSRTASSCPKCGSRV